MENKELRKECAEKFFKFKGKINKHIDKMHEDLVVKAVDSGDEELDLALIKVLNDIREYFDQRYNDMQLYLNGKVDLSWLYGEKHLTKMDGLANEKYVH